MKQTHDRDVLLHLNYISIDNPTLNLSTRENKPSRSHVSIHNKVNNIYLYFIFILA